MKSENYINSKGEQIDFQVDVYTRPNLRDETGAMLAYVGKNILEIMFDQCKIDKTITSFSLEYPERWANILEQRAIPDRMMVCFPNLKKAYIKTHSVYIIQCVHNGHILVYHPKEEYEEKEYKNLKVRYCPSPDEFKGLWVASEKEFKKL